MSDLQDDRPRARLALETTEPTSFGHGFLSGFLSALLGLGALGVVLALRYPAVFGFDRLAPLHDASLLRAALHVALVAAFLLGSISAVLRTNKTLAVVGIGATLVAALLGGSHVADGQAASGAGPRIAVDFFVLNLLLYSAIFVPIERLYPLHGEQPIFRRHWLLDLTYFFVNTVLVEVLTLFTLTPALVLFGWARVPLITETIGAWPVVAQVPLMVLVADFTQYWVHRAFHVVPALWRFHAIHHSAEAMDWLAGSRLHLVDVLVTRGLTYVPIFVLGFSESALLVYVFLVAAQATFIHANVRLETRPLQRVLATPAFHHWHHAAEAEAVDVNFAVHTPIWDLLFGTFHLPARWPSRYGLLHGDDVSTSYVGQLTGPFRKAEGGKGQKENGRVEG